MWTLRKTQSDAELTTTTRGGVRFSLPARSPLRRVRLAHAQQHLQWHGGPLHAPSKGWRLNAWTAPAFKSVGVTSCIVPSTLEWNGPRNCVHGGESLGAPEQQQSAIAIALWQLVAKCEPHRGHAFQRMRHNLGSALRLLNGRNGPPLPSTSKGMASHACAPSGRCMRMQFDPHINPRVYPCD